MAKRSSGAWVRLRSLAVLGFFFVIVISWNAPAVNSQANEDVAQNGSANVEDPVITRSEENRTQSVDNPTQPDDNPGHPEVLLTDLDPKGNCSEEIKNLCTKSSENSLDCISKELSKDESGISDKCKQEWRALKILFYKDLTLSKKLANACEKDINKICSSDIFPGGVLACLRKAKDDLSQACQDEVFVAEQDAVYDFKMDPLLSQKCVVDAAKYCKDIIPGGGRIQTCLRSHTDSISYECKSELFRQETENAGDLRLNLPLYQACLNDKEKFCSQVPPGSSRLKDCLEQNRLNPGFSSSCTIEFDKLLARRSSDFRLNPVLREKCSSDIKMLCSQQREDVGDIANSEPFIIHCLQDFRDILADKECKNEVHNLLALAAEDFRFDKQFAEDCADSKRKYCQGIGNDKVLPCLQSHRESLENKCRGAVFTMEWRLSGDIDYKFAMKQACAIEISKFCHDLPPGHGDVIDCLQQRVDDTYMGADCKKEIIADQLESAKDYRLNYRIYKDCKKDYESICPAPEFCKDTTPCGGKVLKCLQDNREKLTSSECKQDVFNFQLQESKNMELNVPLITACKDALAKSCRRVRGDDHSRKLSCLRRHRSELTDECKREELRFSIMEASDIRLTPTLMNACGSELATMCQNVSPVDGEAFKCLQLHLESLNMGTACKIEVDLQGARQASDYQLDVRVRKECQKDVGKFCSSVSTKEEGHAPVLKCFVQHYKNLSRGCQTEVEYATRMALWQYQFDSDLTLPCDGVVKSSCNSTDAKDIEGFVIGTYGQCLTTLGRKKLVPECGALVRVATRDGFYTGHNYTDSDVAAALRKFEELRGGANLNHSGVGLFWVTSVVALVAILAVTLFRKYSGPPRAYTLVVKQGDV